MVEEPSPLAKIVWPAVASLAGAVTSLSMRPYKDMSAIEIFITLTSGATFAYFVGPWAVEEILGATRSDPRMAGAIYYMLATGSNSLIPFAVKKLGDFFGYRTEERGK